MTSELNQLVDSTLTESSIQDGPGISTKMPVKILRIITRMNIGGPSVHAALLSTGLDSAKFSTCLVVGFSDETEGDLTHLVKGGKVKFIRLTCLKRSIRPIDDLMAFIRILKILYRERPRILHTHMAKAGSLGRLAGLVYNWFGPGRDPKRRIVLIHTFHGHVLRGYFSPWLGRLFVIIECWFARKTDHIIAVSKSIRDELLQLGLGVPSKWRVIPLGLDLSKLNDISLADPSSVSGSVSCGLVGRLVHIKNPELFIEALKRVEAVSNKPRVKGIVVGDGPLRRGLEDRVKKSKLQKKVKFSGWSTDLVKVYSDLDIVCLTSWNEGTPLAVIEAMAAARAVIATDVGGVRDVLTDRELPPQGINPGEFIVTERGVLIRSGDIDGLVRALETLINDPQLRVSLGASARAHIVPRYASSRLLRDITDLYEEIA